MKKTFPKQHQDVQPGREKLMTPQPAEVKPGYRGSGKLSGKAALITGGDSGIGRAVAVMFAQEGADVVIVYLEEHEDAAETKSLVEKQGRRCIAVPGDITRSSFCADVVERTARELGRLDILVNNAGFMHFQGDIETLSDESIDTTFRTNVFSQFYLSRAAVKHLKAGSAIINTASVTAYRGSKHLLDYSASKGAIVSFTRSLARILAPRGIRVNAVAPGPTWTPLIPSSYPAEYVQNFGSDTPLGRAAQPDEIAPCYVFLASGDSSYMTGQVLHPNGGEVINA